MNTAKRQKLSTETTTEGSVLVNIIESDSDMDTASETEQLPLKKRYNICLSYELPIDTPIYSNIPAETFKKNFILKKIIL